MMTWIKENWFKIGIVIAGAIYSLSFFLQQITAAKAHNLNVLTEMRQCVKELNGFGQDSCIEAARDRAFILRHSMPKQSKDLEFYL